LNDEDERTNPIGLFNYADSYWRSARALEKARVNATHRDAPVCFLYYHAIELYLKAHLRSEGFTVKQLRSKKFGHNAVNLRDEAKLKGLHFGDEDDVVLQYMGETEVVIESRYLRTGYFDRPANEALHRTCKSLRQSVGEALKAKGYPVRR
jgi:HEPN domain-containing protein